MTRGQCHGDGLGCTHDNCTPNVCRKYSHLRTTSEKMSPILRAREVAQVEDAYEMPFEEIMMQANPPKPVKRTRP